MLKKVITIVFTKNNHENSGLERHLYVVILTNNEAGRYLLNQTFQFVGFQLHMSS